MNQSTTSATTRLDARQARSLELALAAARTAAENRGQDVLVLDVRQLTQLFDYFVIATGSSRRQLHAISEEIDRKLEQDLGDRRLGREGYTESRWILLDYGSVVVHLFDQESRDFYSLETLWAEADRVPWARPGIDRTGSERPQVESAGDAVPSDRPTYEPHFDWSARTASHLGDDLLE